MSIERAIQPVYGLLLTALMWWLLSDVVTTFSDTFLNVIAFSAALVFLVVFIYELIELLQGGAPGAGSE